MSEKKEKLEELFASLGTQEFFVHPEVQRLILEDPQCAEVYAALAEDNDLSGPNTTVDEKVLSEQLNPAKDLSSLPNLKPDPPPVPATPPISVAAPIQAAPPLPIATSTPAASPSGASSIISEAAPFLNATPAPPNLPPPLPNNTAKAWPGLDLSLPVGGTFGIVSRVTGKFQKIRSTHVVLVGVISSVVTAGLLGALIIFSGVLRPKDQADLVGDKPPVQSETLLDKNAKAESSRSEGVGSPAKKTGDTLRGANKTSGMASKTKGIKDKLSRDDIVGGFKKNMGTTKSCFQTAKASGELPPGRYSIILDWTIRPNGTVQAPKFKEPKSQVGKTLGRCFEEKMLTWKFPASRTGAPVVNFPFPIVAK